MFYERLQPKLATLAVRVFLLMAGVAGLAVAPGQCGQAPAGNPPSASKANPQAPTPAPRVVGNSMPVKSTPKAVGAQPLKTASMEAKGVADPSRKATMPSDASVAAGRRDPFKPWVALSSASHSASEAAPLPPGTRGLLISGLRLEGIVRQETGNAMIAVVTNYTKRAYFLKVNDAVYNGMVSKITPEAVYFKENTLDSRGRAATHEVEIKLGSAPGEGR